MRNVINEFTDVELETLDIGVRNLVTHCVCNGNSYEHAAGMTLAPINRTPGADPAIIRSLWVIRHSKEPLPAFERGEMFFDFDLNKVRFNPARPINSDS